MNRRICLTARHFRELKDLDPKLREVLDDALAHWPEELMETSSIFRHPEEDTALGGSGIHATTPHRAVDLRIKNLEGDFQAKADSVAASLNAL